jgi:hypothetical protein
MSGLRIRGNYANVPQAIDFSGDSHDTDLLGRPVPDEFVYEYQRRTAATLKSELKVVPDIELAAGMTVLVIALLLPHIGCWRRVRTTPLNACATSRN